MKKLAILTGFFFANTLGLYFFLSNTSCAHGNSAQSQSAAEMAKNAGDAQDPKIMSHARQMTFEGPRAGEAYFSADGQKIIFQSEREPGNPFYQIYLMDLQNGKTERVSTGSGKTTCAWVHPSGQKLLFSSTHLDPDFKKKVEEEYAFRKSSQKNKYSWSFDDKFDIFERDLKTGQLKALTKEQGYDAEGAYSPDGKWIVFASNRSAWVDAMTEEDRKLFEQDASYMMEIYIMKADGTDVKRLTNTRGYDGGPFFSADGQKITWRRFAPNGQAAEIYTMNVDGSDQKALTHMKAMSWAPFFHPSGDYLIFTSNKLGFSNFELYIVDAKGEKEPVRVSYLPDFDGLPVFSPNGKSLAWTHRNEKGESQIYMADWDDVKARSLLGLGPIGELELRSLSNEIRATDIQKIIEYLASPKMKGRATASPEERIYTQKLAELFQQMGLEPADGKSYFSEFEFTSQVELGPQNSLHIQAGLEKISGQVSENYTPLSFSSSGIFPQSSVVFAGYGIVAPATEKDSLFDSYKNIDPKGKWVLIFRDLPEGISNEKRHHLNLFSRLQHKVLMAKQRGAVGVLIVSGPNSGSQQKLMKLKYEGTAGGDSGLPVLSVSNELADRLLKTTGRSLKQWQDISDKGELQATEIPNLNLQAQVDLKFKMAKGRNTLAKLSVRGANRTLIIGAHGDHLGQGELGNSLAHNNEQALIHFGADDNASGVAGVLELAHEISNLHRSGKIRLKTNIIFAVWSGEEIGLWGSSSWLKTQDPSKISAYLNMDMIGRYRDSLLVQGAGSAKEWRSLFESWALSTPLSLTLQNDPYVPSDLMAFYVKGVPGLMFFTGSHAEYHSPRDVPALINSEGEEKILKLISRIALDLAGQTQTNEIKLTYLKTESSKSKLEGRSFRVYLGTIPDYAQEGTKGVKISGTSKESPADKAGLQAGDVIIELSGLKIENLYDYVYSLQSLKANQATPLKVQRQGQLKELSIIPILKD